MHTDIIWEVTLIVCIFRSIHHDDKENDEDKDKDKDQGNQMKICIYLSYDSRFRPG